MKIPTIAQQFRRISVPFLSVLVAICALFYNSWRNDTTERNRNIRAAEFEMLKELGELQRVIDFSHFRRDAVRGDLTLGLNHALLIRDYAVLAPKPVEESAEQLLSAWRGNAEQLPASLEAASNLSEQVLITRRVVLDSLRGLR